MRTDTAAFAAKNLELAKRPRYVIELAFDTASTVLWYFTSHDDAALPPSGVSGSILGIVQGLSGTSQTLKPDTANATIGNISFNLVDRGSIVTTTLGAQLVLGRSTRHQRVRVFMGYEGLAWADYTLLPMTQLVTEIGYKDGAYSFRCNDIQREMRKDLFVPAKTTLASSVLAADATINVFDTSAFATAAHGTSYSDAPSATVGYVKIQDEVIRYTGKTSTTFTGCTRGALNTVAADHPADATASSDRRTPVTEYVYLEMPAVKLMYALLTGVLYNQGGAVLPASWHLGIPAGYVRLADFTGIGTDLWNTADDEQGFVARLEDLGKSDGKKFIETELALLCGVFMPVYADGALGCKRMANVLAGAAYVRQLDTGNIVSWGELVHDFTALHNVIQIEWNWEPLQKDFTRENFLIDAGSVATHGRADPLKLSFRALHGSRHSSAILAQRFDALRDRYTGPPLRLDLNVVPSLNTLEVGDVVRVRPEGVRDFVASGALDRSFEIQNIAINWITGSMALKLFASSQAPGALAATSDATVLTQAWYVGAGTVLSSVLTITGSNPGHVSANGALAGNADMNAAGAIYYYDGDLQIDAGVTVTLGNNVQLRVRGFLQNNGMLTGQGGGLAGAAAVVIAANDHDYNPGAAGFIGATEAGGGLSNAFSAAAFNSVRGGGVVAPNSVVPELNLAWDGATLRGIPGDLRGTSGSSGMPSAILQPRYIAPGGAGGAGGAGLVLICRGFAQGTAGVVNLSGADGDIGSELNGIRKGVTYYSRSGSGAGGAPGAFAVILDGAGATATGLTEAGFVALNGKTRIFPSAIDSPSWIDPGFTPSSFLYSFFVGTGDGTTFPLPSLSGARGGSRVQFVPGNPAAAADPKDLVKEQELEELLAANWTERSNPKALTLNSVVWMDSQFVAVGLADGTDAYIVTSPDGVTWTEQANPKALQLSSIAWNGSLLVAVGDHDGTDAYIITSPDGVTWTERANPKADFLAGIVWAGTQFVAVGLGDGTDAYIITSPDGITWTEQANPTSDSLFSAAWNGSLLVAVGSHDGTDAYIVTSPDGVTWTEQANPKARGLNAVVWMGSKFVAVGDADGTDAYLLTSPDGVTWTEQANPRNLKLSGIVWSGVLLVAVGGTTIFTPGYIMTSRDGVNWTIRDNPKVVALNATAWSGRKFVTVGAADATDAFIATSLSK